MKYSWYSTEHEEEYNTTDNIVLNRQPVVRSLATFRVNDKTNLAFCRDANGVVLYYSPSGTDFVYQAPSHPGTPKKPKLVMAPPPPSMALGNRITRATIAPVQAAQAEDQDEEEPHPVLAVGHTVDVPTPKKHTTIAPGFCKPTTTKDKIPRRHHLVAVGDRIMTVQDCQALDREITVADFVRRYVSKTAQECDEEQRFPQRSPEWKRARKYCVTTSQFGAAAGLSPYSNPADVAKDKLWELFSGNDATYWGTKNEPKAESAYQSWCKADLYSKYLASHGRDKALAASRSLVLQEHGLIKYPASPWMGASPDGVAVWTDPDGVVKRRLVEYKCPFFLWQANGKHPYAKFDKKMGMPVPPQYHAQIQGVMGMFADEDERIRSKDPKRSSRQETWNIDECDFVVWQPKRLWVTRVARNETFWKAVLEPKLKAWFAKVYLPASVEQYNGNLGDEQIRRSVTQMA